jgi:hypothetical protein
MSTNRRRELPPPPDLALPAPNRVAFREEVTAHVAATLRRARAAEQSAVGEQRIPAFRVTRALIAGTRSVGYTDAQVAECLGMKVSGVRARGGSDGWIAVDDFGDLADLPTETIERWAAAGVLLNAATDTTGHRYYLASELMRAVANGDAG